MAELPHLPQPEALAGVWIVRPAEGRSGDCRAVLEAGGSSPRLRLDPACAELLGLAGAVRWRPASDGLAFAAEDQTTVVFFSREGADYIARRDGRSILTLTRQGAPGA